MHIICSNCGLKSPVEAGGLAVETRLVCARCEVEVEIKFTDEPVAAATSTELALFEAFAETLEEKLGPLPETRIEDEASDVLGLEELSSPATDDGVLEQGLVLEQGQPMAVGQLPPYLSAGDSPASAEQDEEEVEEVSEERSALKLEWETARAEQSFDKYSVGVRLLQVSPMWLLVTGLSFISFIVLCNWFFVPVNLAQADVTRPAVRGNQATNQPAEQVVAPSLPADEATDAPEVAQPGARPAESPAQAAAQPTPEPAPATAAPVAPPADDKKAAVPVAAAPQESTESKSDPNGKFTLQVGSYNVAAEAEARAAGLKAAGVEARVAQVEIPKRGTWYRVQAGRFASREEAERNGRQLREKGLAASYLTAELR